MFKEMDKVMQMIMGDLGVDVHGLTVIAASWEEKNG
jgi:hypothetical protein